MYARPKHGRASCVTGGSDPRSPKGPEGGRYRPFYGFCRAPVLGSGLVFFLLCNALGWAVAENRKENHEETRFRTVFPRLSSSGRTRNSHEGAVGHGNTRLKDKWTPTFTYSQKVDANPQRKTARLCGKIVFLSCSETVCEKDVRSPGHKFTLTARPGNSIRRHPLAILRPANWYRGKPEDGSAASRCRVAPKTKRVPLIPNGRDV